MELYKGKKRYEVPPHVYSIADGAYRNMLLGKHCVECRWRVPGSGRDNWKGAWQGPKAVA